MDETTLNDLLECSVCLERLDTTSKVLPCQHTFCRGCLEVIVASRNELRCPECRVLVDIKIDELPPNVLLMRILEGLKNSTISGGKAIANEQQEKEKQNQQTAQASQHKHQQQQQQQQQQANTQRRCLLPHAYALYDFNSTEPTDLHFKKGDLILLKQKIDANWFVGQLNGVEGTFPSNYVQVMVQLPTPQAIALYDFKMQPNEEEGCLNFKKGASVHVLRRVDQNWAEGRIGNAIGIFPIAFVELNVLAKKLLERVEPKPTIMAQNQQTLEQYTPLCHAAARNIPPIPLLDPTTNTSDTTTPSSSSPSSHSNITSPSASDNLNAAITNTSSSSNLSTNSNSLPNTPQHYAHSSGGGSVRYRNGREKRHSLNALLLNGSGNSTPGLSILQTNRHSAEILSIPSEELIVGSNKNQAGAAMSQCSAAHEQRQSTALETLQPTTQQHTTTRANVLKTACGPTNVPSTLPWGYLALYPYKPRKSDELELKKGCVYIVTERCIDGWFKGKNWQDISGVFPGNYVTPLRTRDQQQLMHQWKPQPTVNNSPSLATSTTHTGNLNQPLNNNLSTMQNQTKTFPKPPELPPRHAVTTTTCASVWTKPLSHTVEAFFNRSSSSTKSDEKHKEKEAKSKDTSSSGAVSLMKRLTHIKSRAKSPGAAARGTAPSPTTTALVAENPSTTIGNRPVETTLQASTNLQPVHIRSGSCPSQLLQNLPQNSANVGNLQTQQQQHATNPMNHGSERIKGHKERPRIQATRQSMDGTLRAGIYANISNTAPTAAMMTNNFQLNSKCGQQFQMQQQQFLSSPHNSYHRKSHSLDANNVLCGSMGNSVPPALPLVPPNCNITAAAVAQSATTKSAHCGRESRFRCIVPYPPNSDVELELHVGDIIYVQRKQKNGWYKGTHARTAKTGLFPASFVEPDL